MKYAFHTCLDIKIGLAALGSDAGMIGSALFAAED